MTIVFVWEANHWFFRRSTHQKKRCEVKLYCLGLFLIVASFGCAQAKQSDGDAAFQKLSALAGDWEGSYEWSGARHDSGKMNVHYYLTGNGSALVEDLSTGGPPSMTSVYHLDNGDLRATHFCGARNQPRLKAEKIDLVKNAIEFGFVDVTNVTSMAAPFVHGLDVQMVSADELVLIFHFEAAGKKSVEHINLKRVGGNSKT